MPGCDAEVMTDEPQVAVIAKLRAHPGRGEELVDALMPLFDDLRELPGTPVFTLQRVVDDPDAVIFYELHRDDLAFRVADDAAVGRVGERMAELLAEAPEITMCSPVRLYGVDPLHGG